MHKRTDTVPPMKKAEAYSTIHPGEVLDLTLKERGIAQKEFASTIGMPASVLNAIINKKRSVTPDIAVLLEAALGKEATFWLALQAQRDIEEAKMKEAFIKKQRDIETWNEIKDYCNVKYLEKFFKDGLGTTIQEKIEAVFKLFGVNDIQGLRSRFLNNVDPAFFRKSDSFTYNPVNIFTWKYMAFSASDQYTDQLRPFAKDNLEFLINRLLIIFYDNHNTLQRLSETLADYGIKLILLENENGTHVDGFSFWRGDNPTITLTQRGKKLDILAFTLFHEICHVYKHLDRSNEEKTCISMDGDKNSPEEREADTFANDHLIPNRDWQLFKAAYASTSPYAMGPKIRAFAEQRKIHPSIVLGRYQHDFKVFDNGRGIERSIN